MLPTLGIQMETPVKCRSPVQNLCMEPPRRETLPLCPQRLIGYPAHLVQSNGWCAQLPSSGHSWKQLTA